MFDLAERKLFESRAGKNSPFQVGIGGIAGRVRSSSSAKILPRKSVAGYQQRVRTSLLDDLSVKTPEKAALFGTTTSSATISSEPSRGQQQLRSSNYDDDQYPIKTTGSTNKDYYVFDRFMQPQNHHLEHDKLFDYDNDDNDDDDQHAMELVGNHVPPINKDKLNPTIKNELKVMLMTMAKDTPTSPVELVISPSDLRRCIHTVDPSLSRSEIICLARALLDGSSSPHRVRVGRVIRNLEKL